MKFKVVIFFKLISKTNITSGEGSCAQAGTTDDNTFYCPNGAECNNFAGKTCWDPVSGQATSTLCKADEWQCEVCVILVFCQNVFFCSLNS
jgi:hypothetical protein